MGDSTILWGSQAYCGNRNICDGFLYSMGDFNIVWGIII